MNEIKETQMQIIVSSNQKQQTFFFFYIAKKMYIIKIIRVLFDISIKQTIIRKNKIRYVRKTSRMQQTKSREKKFCNH